MLSRRELLTGAGVAAIAAGLPDDLEALTPQQRSAVLGGANAPAGFAFKTDVNGNRIYDANNKPIFVVKSS